MSKERLLIAVTGASGQVYAANLYQIVKRELSSVEPTLLFTDTAKVVWRDELREPLLSALDGLIEEKTVGRALEESIDNSSYYHPFASGSNHPDKMVIIPATMGTVARVANGTGGDLVARVADVMIKEKAPLVVVPRETPLSIIHLKNITTLAEAGATILPATPQFYTHPTSMAELVDNFCRRTLQSLGYGEVVKRRFE